MNLAEAAWIWKFLLAHQVAAGLLAYWAFSAYASQLAPPLPMASPFYRWWYSFVHLAAANLDRFRGK